MSIFQTSTKRVRRHGNKGKTEGKGDFGVALFIPHNFQEKKNINKKNQGGIEITEKVRARGKFGVAFFYDTTLLAPVYKFPHKKKCCAHSGSIPSEEFRTILSNFGKRRKKLKSQFFQTSTKETRGHRNKGKSEGKGEVRSCTFASLSPNFIKSRSEGKDGKK